MNIKLNNKPTYTLELSQEEFLVLFEAMGARSDGDWESYQQEHGLTDEQTKYLKIVSYSVYKDMDNYIEDKVNPPNDEYFTSENWLAQQYTEKYKD